MTGEVPPKRLLVSIHDVGPRFEREIDQLFDRLVRLIGAPKIAMLVVPDHWDQAPLSASPAYQRKLRTWADDGVEMFLHGWSHKDDSRHEGPLAGFKARHMTAGEGEFLGLSAAEALHRMGKGRQVVEDAIGRPVAGFIAPAWLYGPGAHAAMAEMGFPLAEDHMRVWRPGSNRNLAKGPVVTWASRSRSRIASSLFFAGLARFGLKPLPTLRVAVHPGDTRVPAILRSIDATMQSALRHRTVARYADLRI